MNSLRLALTVGFLSLISPVLAGTGPELQPAPSPSDENKNSTEIFNYETVYTGNSDFKDYRGKFGDGDSLYNDFSYAHRFLITGNWYLRLGVEYERFDFGGTNNGLPDHLQTLHALLAYEYIVHDHAGAGIEIDPGPYWQNHIDGDAIDVPWKVWVTFPLKKDKIFAVIGAGGSLYSNPIAAPGGGLIWLFTDHLRLEGVFPKPALVYNPNDDWEFRLAGNLFYESYRTDDVITPARKLQVHNAIVQYSEDRAGLQITYSQRLHVPTGLRFLPRRSGREVGSRAVRPVRGRSEVLRENLVELSRDRLTAVDFQSAGHERPRAFKFSVRHRDPIVVARDKGHAWIVDLTSAHFVSAVVHFDPPIAAIRSAQFPLITSVHTLRLVRLKTLTHSVKDLLRRGIIFGPKRGRADHRQHRCR